MNFTSQKTKEKVEKRKTHFFQASVFELWTEVVFMRWHQHKACVFTKAGMPALSRVVLFFFGKLYTESSPVTQKRLVTVGWYYRDRNRQVSVAKDLQRDSRYLKNGVIDLPLPVIYSFFQWLTAAQFIRLCCVRNIWIDT